MRRTKLALVIFGCGLLLGLVVVVGKIDALGRVASLLMVLGIVGIPIGGLLDWRHAGSERKRRRARVAGKGGVDGRVRKPRRPKR